MTTLLIVLIMQGIMSVFACGTVDQKQQHMDVPILVQIVCFTYILYRKMITGWGQPSFTSISKRVQILPAELWDKKSVMFMGNLESIPPSHWCIPGKHPGIGAN